MQAFVQQQSMVDKQGGDPLNHIFRALDAAKLRDPLSLKPGPHLLAGTVPALNIGSMVLIFRV